MMKKHCATREDRLTGIRETVAITNQSRSTIIRAVAAGRFPEPLKIGPQRRWTWKLSVLKAWVAAQEKSEE